MEKRKLRVILLSLCAALAVVALAFYCIRYYQAVQLLEMGIRGDAADTRQQLADYKLVSGLLSVRAGSRCRRLIYDGAYSEACNLYIALSDHPKATAKMDQHLDDYVKMMIGLDDWDTIVQIGAAFRQCDGGYAAIEARLETYLLGLRAGSEMTYRDHYRDLAAEGVIVEKIGVIIYDQFCDAVERKDFTDARSELTCLVGDEKRMTAVYAYLMEKMEGHLQNNEASKVDFIHHLLRFEKLEYECFSAAIYQRACELMEQRKFAEAGDFLYLLYNPKDPYYYNDVYFMLLQLWMREYLDEGKYDEAKKLIGGYTGERREILQEIYREYVPEE